jgi:hypothetical protein
MSWQSVKSCQKKVDVANQEYLREYLLECLSLSGFWVARTIGIEPYLTECQKSKILDIISSCNHCAKVINFGNTQETL